MGDFSSEISGAAKPRCVRRRDVRPWAQVVMMVHIVVTAAIYRKPEVGSAHTTVSSRGSFNLWTEMNFSSFIDSLNSFLRLLPPPFHVHIHIHREPP